MRKPNVDWFKKHAATERDWDLAVHFVNGAQGNPPDSVAEVALTALLAQVRIAAYGECIEAVRACVRSGSYDDDRETDGIARASEAIEARCAKETK